MRLVTLLLLLVVMAVSSASWYVLEIATCSTPIYYRLGQLDDAFGVTPEVAKEHIKAATDVWQQLTSRSLFIYDERASFTINFMYDERQATTDAVETFSEQINRLATAVASFENNVTEREAALRTARTSYEERLARYQTNVTAFEQERAEYIASGERTVRKEANLERQRLSLNAEAASLQRAAEALNELGQRFNTFVDEGNAVIQEYNSLVNSFNARFGQRREFTQGDFQGDRINIYTFTDYLELQRVLVHEFGHALGIGHVEDETAIMYHMLGSQPEVPTLQPDDRAAFAAVCLADDTWYLQLQILLRTTLFKLFTI